MTAPAQSTPATLTLEELTSRIGLSVRHVRVDTSRGLIPTPNHR